jgi:hypothetical protein
MRRPRSMMHDTRRSTLAHVRAPVRVVDGRVCVASIAFDARRAIAGTVLRFNRHTTSTSFLLQPVTSRGDGQIRSRFS